jgi:hypothetical protein
MDQSIKIKLQKLAEQAKGPAVYSNHRIQEKPDNLSKVIRNKRDADHFMAELDAITRSTKK